MNICGNRCLHRHQCFVDEKMALKKRPSESNQVGWANHNRGCSSDSKNCSCLCSLSLLHSSVNECQYSHLTDLETESPKDGNLMKDTELIRYSLHQNQRGGSRLSFYPPNKPPLYKNLSFRIMDCHCQFQVSRGEVDEHHPFIKTGYLVQEHTDA